MIKSIQILRGLAAWAVVFHHISQLMFEFSTSSEWMHNLALKAGHGVDIFFVISGFIIYRSISQKYVSPLSFSINRIARIVPAYWFYTILVVLIANTYPGVMSFTETGFDYVLKGLIFIPVVNQQTGWYIPALTVGWTLNFEMLFYSCIFLSLFFKDDVKKLCCILIPVTVMNLFSWLGSNELPVFLFYTDELMFEFVMGVMVAVCYENGLFKGIGVKIALIMIALSLVSIFFSSESRRLLQIGIPCAILVIASICLEQKISDGFFSNLATKLGDWSYSTYLSHVIIICVINKLSDVYVLNKYIMIVPIVTLVLLCSYLSYKFIELPCSRVAKLKFKGVNKQYITK
ncbi:acyltransferase family protein [Enterobacter cloacae]